MELVPTKGRPSRSSVLQEIIICFGSSVPEASTAFGTFFKLKSSVRLRPKSRLRRLASDTHSLRLGVQEIICLINSEPVPFGAGSFLRKRRRLQAVMDQGPHKGCLVGRGGAAE